MYYVEDGELKQKDNNGQWDLGMEDKDMVGYGYESQIDDELSLEDEIIIDDLNEDSDIPVKDDAPQIIMYSIPEESYNDLIDTLVLVSNPAIYPNASALDLFLSVLNSYDYNGYYFIVAGSSASDVYMYTGDTYTYSGNVLSLSGNSKQHHYYTYRPTSSSVTQYLYTVNDFIDPQVTLSNTLVYTNAVKGYPDIIPHDQHRSYIYTALIAFVFIFLVPKIMKRKVAK